MRRLLLATALALPFAASAQTVTPASSATTTAAYTAASGTIIQTAGATWLEADLWGGGGPGGNGPTLGGAGGGAGCNNARTAGAGGGGSAGEIIAKQG